MNKKKWFNGKIFFTITLVFVLCCFMATGSWAARKLEINMANAKSFIGQLNQKSAAMGPAFGLSPDEGFQLLRKRTDFNGETHYRYQQTFKGIPVWGMQTIISRDPGNKVKKIHGNVVQGIPDDIVGIPSSLDPLGALKRMEELHKEKNISAAWNFTNEKYGTYICFIKGKAHLCYVVSFFADTECGNPSQPVFFVDVKSGNVIHSFNGLMSAEGIGPGGNLKTGYYYYGTDYPGFGVTVDGSICTMETPYVKTFDLNHATTGGTVFSYTCYENTYQEINGAYCPLNDAQYFGRVVYDMYNDWYGFSPVPLPLTLKCHYGVNHENAYWSDEGMLFGDGADILYPVVCLDVVSHETCHGFIIFNSDLILDGISGGINESFCDMAGEAAEFYMRGANDFKLGYDVVKDPNGAIRYMYDPPLDGVSIDHVDDYYDGMEIHQSCGVFNKAFWLIATTPGWNTHMAFDIFVKANLDYWTPSTNFQQGAEGAQYAAADYGYPCQDVVNAFAQVGIDLVCPEPPVADFAAFPPSGGVPLTTTFTDLSQGASSWLWDFGDGGSSTEQNPTYTYNTMGVYTVTLTAANEFGSDIKTRVDYITVTAPMPPIADFTASATDIYIGNSVQFTDTSLENPTSWSWTFEGGTPATSTAQNPMVTYNTPGKFDVTLLVSNAQGSDTETKLDYISVTEKPYCASKGTYFIWEWIAGVQVGTMYNGSDNAGYTDFTSITCDLSAGDTVNVVLTPGFSDYPYTEYWKIWIDYNNDKDFDDAGEEVFSGFASSTVSGSFTVADVDIVTRMRVSMKYDAYATPCETFTYGEVEDYTVVIGGCATQAPKADFTASATTILVGDNVTFTDLSTNDPYVWNWTFAGGTPGTSTQQNPAITYNTTGTYTVALTATNECGSGTETKVGYITVIEDGEMYVYDITQTANKTGINYTSTAVVTIRDTNNNPVANATVYITWSGVVSGSASGVTGADGTVGFTSAKVKANGPFTIMVDNVTHTILPYNPGINNETSDTATF